MNGIFPTPLQAVDEREAMKVLAELVMCKDMSEEVARLLTIPNADHPIVCADRARLAAEYESRKPVAWERARALLAPLLLEAPQRQTSDQFHLPVIGASDESLQPLLDAQRYRWLRDKAVWFDGEGERMVWCVIGTGADDCRPCDGEELDEMIDAALRASSAPTTKQGD